LKIYECNFNQLPKRAGRDNILAIRKLQGNQPIIGLLIAVNLDDEDAKG
jgi:hypothetical protein